MANTGKALTNVAFRAKMLALIDKLKNQDKTALVRHVDDFEQLNKDTFEAGMNALVEAIPEGGGGGGGTGDGGYAVTFTADVSAMEENETIACNKTIEDIIAHADEHITGRLIFKNIPIEGAEGTYFDVYLDNLKFDYQKIVTNNPDIEPMVPQVTYIGFVGDFGAAGALSGEPTTNDGPDYYKTYIKICWLFADETPHWNLITEEIGGGSSEYIEPANIIFNSDYTYALNNNQYYIKLLSTPDSDGSNAQIYFNDGSSGSGRSEQYIFDYFIPPYLRDGYMLRRTALYSPITIGVGGNQICMYNKPAQIEVHINGTDLTPSFWTKGIFTIDKYEEGSTTNNSNTSGTIEMHMDEDDASNNRIIRHYIKIELIQDTPSGLHHAKNTYKKLIIPYTVG